MRMFRRLMRGIGPIFRTFVVLFGLAFSGLGLVLTLLVVEEVREDEPSWGWTETACTVLDSGVVIPATQDEVYRFRVVYEWRWEGRRFTGDVYRPGYDGAEAVARAYRLAWLHPPGSRVACWVDPESPEDAVLVPGRRWKLLVALVPLAFSIVGLLVVAGGLFPGKRPERPAVTAAAVEERDRGPGGMLLLFGSFLGLGLLLLLPMVVAPLLEGLATRSWMEVPATVLDSQVRTHRDSDGHTYSADILYRYEVDGVEFRSNRYGLLAESTGYRESHEEIVARYPPGSRTTAFVDPDEPWSALLHRGVGGLVWAALVPLFLVAFGACGVGYVLGWWQPAGNRQGTGTASWMPVRRRASPTEAGAAELKSRFSPWQRFLGMLGAALLWNGFVAMCVHHWWDGVRRGDTDGCLTVFLIPFVLVGLVLLWLVAYPFRSLFHPRPVVTLDPPVLAPGAEATVHWSFRGRTGRLRHLILTLEAREEATYQQGSDSWTETETFFERVLADTDAATRGSARLAVPRNAMHSFHSNSNKIAWCLKLRATVDGSSNIEEEFPLVVAPR